MSEELLDEDGTGIRFLSLRLEERLKKFTISRRMPRGSSDPELHVAVLRQSNELGRCFFPRTLDVYAKCLFGAHRSVLEGDDSALIRPTEVGLLKLGR